jgi:hypothetical protein
MQKSVNYEQLLNYSSSDLEKWEGLYIDEKIVEELVIDEEEIPDTM